MTDQDGVPILTKNKIRIGDLLFPYHSQTTTTRPKRDIAHKKYQGGDIQDIGFTPQWVYRQTNGKLYFVPDIMDTKSIAENTRRTTKQKTKQNKKKHAIAETPLSSHGSTYSVSHDIQLRPRKKKELSSSSRSDRETLPTIKRRKISHVPDTETYRNRKQLENRRFLDDVLTYIAPLKRIDTINVMFLDDFENGQQGKKTYTLGSIKGLVSKLGGIHPSRAYIFNPSSAVVRAALSRKTHAYPMLVKEGLQTIKLPKFDGVYLDYTSRWDTVSKQGDLNELFNRSRPHLSDTFVLHMTFSRRGIKDENLPQLAEMIKQNMIDLAEDFIPVFQNIDMFPESKKTIKYYSLWKRKDM